MELNQVSVPALDVAKSLAFYQGLGLHAIVDALPHYARLECPQGGATFSLHHVETFNASPEVVIHFECDDLDDKVKHLQTQGYVFDQLPKDESWLWREARLRDPSNNVLCLYYAGVNRRYPPWRLPDEQGS